MTECSEIAHHAARTATVSAGAALGACARFCLQLAFPSALWTLFTINMIACLVMGFFRPGLFWGKGVLGGFSSFSAVAVLAYHVPLATAVGYFALTMVGALAMWFIGDCLHRGGQHNPAVREVGRQ